MTAPSTWFTYRPNRTIDLASSPPTPGEVSVVIPVRDNSVGLRSLLASLQALYRSPREIIVVDNLSVAPLDPKEVGAAVLAACSVPGPAAARNVGAQAATGKWLWFVDSDCVVRPDTLENFCAEWKGAIASAGRIRSAGGGALARYYEDQEILLPQFAEDDEPLYLVTASALIFKEAFFAVKGFDERFPSAAAEDIDLGLRLFERGRLAFSSCAVVHHKFERSMESFRARFRRMAQATAYWQPSTVFRCVRSRFTQTGRRL